MATPCCSFQVHAELGAARAGTLLVTHGAVRTPAFMPVGSGGTIKGIDPAEARQAGADMILANTFHLWERPGHEVVRGLGGLHRFMGWDGPILTDSGGYQIFSLKERARLDEGGVTFRSPVDGRARRLTPELAVEIQEALGVDVAMALDECLEWPATRERTVEATERTNRWLERCLSARRAPDRTALFGIVQGGTFEDLRASHADRLAGLELDGIAIGGLSVGEGHEAMKAMVEVVAPRLPRTKVRYLMGVGHPVDIVEAVILGVDLFDCVLPTRLGRHGQAYTWNGRVNLKNGRFREDAGLLDPGTPTSPANRFSKAYLCHLLRSEEMLGRRLLALHNLHFFQQLMSELRAVIGAGDAAGLASLRERARLASRPPDGAPLADRGSSE